MSDCKPEKCGKHKQDGARDAAESDTPVYAGFTTNVPVVKIFKAEDAVYKEPPRDTPVIKKKGLTVFAAVKDTQEKSDPGQQWETPTAQSVSPYAPPPPQLPPPPPKLPQSALPAPLPAPNSKIPLMDSKRKTESEKRLDKLEELMTTFMQKNEEFQEDVFRQIGQQYSGYHSCEQNEHYDEQYEHYDDDEAAPEQAYKEQDDEAATQGGVTDSSTPPAQEVKLQGFAAKFAETEYGAAIGEGTAASLQYLLTTKLPEKPMTDILDKYNTPSNTKNLSVPKVNQQIWDSLRPHVRQNDSKLQKVQSLMVKGLTAIAQTPGELPANLEDGMACLASAIYEMNMLRRDFIKPGLQDKFAPLCKPAIPVTENLFGDDLPKRIKDIDEVHKVTGKVAKQQRYTPYLWNGARGRGMYELIILISIS